MRIPGTVASLLLACLSLFASWDARAQDATASTTGASGVIEGAPTATRYAGYGDAEALNAGVPRYPGDPAALAYIERNFALTGEFGQPVVLLSNAVDPILPRQFGVRYIDLARAAGNEDLLTVLPPVGEGHCNFTDAQVRAALDALEQAVARSPRGR